MNNETQVDEKIKQLKASGIPLTDAAWEAALACEGWPYIFGAAGQECTPSYRTSVYNKDPNKECYANVKKSCQAINGKTSSCGGCKWYPNGKRVRSFDCRGFTRWILKQIYGWTLKGSGCTAQWNEESNWKEKGTIDTIPEDKLVCLFYRDKKNPKLMAHTGFGYRGETCECSAGVQHKKKRDAKWEYWAVPACEEGEPDPSYRPTLRKGDKGSYVTLAQTELLQKGYELPKYGADGSFGNETLAAVKKLQEENGLRPDGVIGPDTWAVLDQDVKRTLYTVTIPHCTKYQAEAIVKQYTGAFMVQEGE